MIRNETDSIYGLMLKQHSLIQIIEKVEQTNAINMWCHSEHDVEKLFFRHEI